MEEKKSIKINLSTLFLILVIIVIAIMGYFIYKFYNDKKIANNKLEELQNEVSGLESTVNSLQGTIGSNNNIDSDENDAEKSFLSEKEALKVLEEKFNIVENMWLDAENFFTKTSNDEVKDFEKTILKEGTENLLKEAKNNLPWGIRLENNKYYIVQHGGDRGYAGLDGFENIIVTDSTITATLKTKQSIYDESIDDWISTADKKSEFKLIKEGNNWLIDIFNSSDLN